ncbi:MAG: peptidase S1 [Pseudomonadota bacterium]
MFACLRYVTRRITGLSVVLGAALVPVALAGPAAACPSYNNPTVFGSANVPANFAPDPWTRNVTAGGMQSLFDCGFSFPGFVVSPTGILTIAVEADSAAIDTVILVNAPDGSWHWNDDYRGLNSAITFQNPLQGQYDIWFGTLNRSSNNRARLILTELSY